jgi:RNA polymerase primary sigma factor
VWWIRQSILQALAEQARMVRLPLNHVGSLNKINREKNKLQQELERDPTADELSIALGIHVTKTNNLMEVKQLHVSLDAPLAPDGEGDTL